MKSPKLILVGAGPGDPELITLKAINALREADVILYDKLVNLSLLDYCHPLCEKIFVGKEGHKPGISQDGINYLIVEKAYQKGTVVRLKGGDPFIFGRGGEETRFARQRGVETIFVPGISSFQTLGINDIPLTDRQYADGFWVITGHKSDGSLSKDIELAAQSNSTLVILMGMSKISLIQKLMLQNGAGAKPFSIIANATFENQRIIKGTIENMEYLVLRNNIKNPAVIVIGEVVNSLNLPEKLSELMLQENVY